MKKVLYLSALLTLAACSQFMIQEQFNEAISETEHQGATQGATQEITLTASLPISDEEKTKTSRNSSGKVSWSAHEYISLFYGSGSSGGSRFTSTNSTSATTVQFTGTINVITGVAEESADNYFFWGVYPYNNTNSCDGTSVVTTIPNIQNSKAGSFSDEQFPSIGRSEGLVMSFYNVCGGFKFTLGQSGISRVTIRGNNNEALAGKVRLRMDEYGKPVVDEIIDGETDIVITPYGRSTFLTDQEYYIVIRPVSFTQGVTFFLEKEDGSVATRKVNASFSISRSQFEHASASIDTGVTFTPGAVDLGLSIMWASCNVGATSSEGYGDYYAWGELEPYYSKQSPLTWKSGKTDGYSWTSYSLCNGSGTTLTKYNYYSGNGVVDNKAVLEMEDDAAYINWGGSWRIPTKAEWEELTNTDNCDWTWTTYNGKNGYRVTSKKEGYADKWIFLPAAGYRSGTQLSLDSSLGGYITSSLYNTNYGNSQSAFYSGINFTSENVNTNTQETRIFGSSIRPVCSSFSTVPITGINLNKSSLSLTLNTSEDLYATPAPQNAQLPGLTWVSSNGTVATVSVLGRVSAVGEGSCTITATTKDGTFSASCTVTVEKPVPAAVDLGLSVKWASWNVGATAPEEYGDYFGWGEALPYYTEGNAQVDYCTSWRVNKTGYNWTSYTWSNNSGNRFNKYCPSSSSSYWNGDGDPDNKTVLDFSDDAAYANLGSNWRMPTDEEWQELMNTSNCTWTFTTLNDINGWRVTSKKSGYTSNSIFIPLAGTRQYDRITYRGSEGYYWSSSLGTYSKAKRVMLTSGNKARGSDDRYLGRSVRAVQD